MRDVVSDKPLRKRLAMATCIVTKKANVETNENKISNVATMFTTARDKKQYKGRIRKGSIVVDLAKEEFPKGVATHSVCNLICVVTTLKNTTIILGTKSRLRAPMVTHSTKMRESNGESILFGNIRILINEGRDGTNTRRSAKKNMELVLQMRAEIKRGRAGTNLPINNFLR